MIKGRNDLKRVLDIEKRMYVTDDLVTYIKLMMLKDQDYMLWKYVRSLRYTEYHNNAGHKIRYQFWQRKKNKLGSRLGIAMWHNTVGEGLRIWHYGSIIVNGHAQVGKNCQFHGDNCIGNKGKSNQKAPVVGDNIDIGVGAVIIGDIFLADDIKIGANAVVTKSCYEKGAILVGAPARPLDKGINGGYDEERIDNERNTGDCSGYSDNHC